MPEARSYKIRSDLIKTEPKDPFRVYFNQTALVNHGLKPGTTFLLTDRENGRQFMATAWFSEQKLNDGVVVVSRAFQEMHDLSLEDRVSVEKLHDDAIPIADSISIYEVQNPEIEGLIDSDPNEQQSYIASIKAQRFLKSPSIAIGMTFEFKSGPSKRTFKVAKATPIFPYKAIYHVKQDTTIDITTESQNGSLTPAELVISDEKIGGLAVQVEQLQDHLDDYSEEGDDPLLHRCLEGGILLCGRSGTGKSLLVDAISAAGWQRVFHIREDRLIGDAAGLKSDIEMALKLEPSLVVLDPLEDLIAGRKSDLLVDAFNRTARTRVLILGATSNLGDLPERYRRQGLFKYQINVPVPDSKARAEILKIMGGLSKGTASDLVDGIAARTHGFVASDLDVLLAKARRKARKRVKKEHSASIERELADVKLNGSSPKQPLTIKNLELTDWEQALAETRPSAMYDVVLETPKTRWSDIGGYHAIKEELRFTIGLQIRYGEGWQSFKLEPTRGILLYGPPGCSKTMIAKAVATEMGFNFLAIKGAEVLDKYVGESERKIREIFDTARAASPSIIFFDEIDAIGATRASSDSGVQGGLHLLTTMLNEMDGIEARRDVFVLAATNMPEVLDPALMRPGRLDRHILIDLPDDEARQEIIRSKLKDSRYPVDASLIEWLTGATAGHSGAEVVQVVKEAVTIMFEEHEKLGTELAIGRRCFEHALGRVESRVTQSEVDKLRAWGKRF